MAAVVKTRAGSGIPMSATNKSVKRAGRRGVKRLGRQDVLLTAARLAVVLTDVVVHVILTMVI